MRTVPSSFRHRDTSLSFFTFPCSLRPSFLLLSFNLDTFIFFIFFIFFLLYHFYFYGVLLYTRESEFVFLQLCFLKTQFYSLSLSHIYWLVRSFALSCVRLYLSVSLLVWCYSFLCSGGTLYANLNGYDDRKPRVIVSHSPRLLSYVDNSCTFPSPPSAVLVLSHHSLPSCFSGTRSEENEGER